ncbi:MAG: YHS domain-containing protein [Gammaproteobacteria bacterium]|nr:YHS domain-containing protein [Gammaproteobacteria bacterium]
MLTHALRSFSRFPEPAPQQARALFADPVCGQTLNEFRTAASVVYRGATYHFCSGGCHARFSSEPGKYHEAATRYMNKS